MDLLAMVPLGRQGAPLSAMLDPLDMAPHVQGPTHPLQLLHTLITPHPLDMAPHMECHPQDMGHLPPMAHPHLATVHHHRVSRIDMVI